VWNSRKDKSAALIACFTTRCGNSFSVGSGSRGTVRGRGGIGTPMKDPVVTQAGMKVPLSGREIDEVFLV
jgi:hypothetical protein